MSVPVVTVLSFPDPRLQQASHLAATPKQHHTQPLGVPTHPDGPNGRRSPVGAARWPPTGVQGIHLTLLYRSCCEYDPYLSLRVEDGPVPSKGCIVIDLYPYRLLDVLTVPATGGGSDVTLEPPGLCAEQSRGRTPSSPAPGGQAHTGGPPALGRGTTCIAIERRRHVVVMTDDLKRVRPCRKEMRIPVYSSNQHIRGPPPRAHPGALWCRRAASGGQGRGSVRRRFLCGGRDEDEARTERLTYVLSDLTNQLRASYEPAAAKMELLGLWMEGRTV
ncbi:unnamed protein product [Arctogadus glacialis]